MPEPDVLVPSFAVVRTRGIAPPSLHAFAMFATHGVPYVEVAFTDELLLATARNEVLDRLDAEWLVFLDNRARPSETWVDAVLGDLSRAAADAACAATIGTVIPDGLDPGTGRHPDIAYRRPVLLELGGFGDEDAHIGREDWDVQLRLVSCGFSVRRGRRSLPS